MNARTENHGLDMVAIKVTQLLTGLLARNCQPTRMQESLDSIRGLLDCLPMDTVEYNMANLRIKNAQRFLESNEAGAAKFEIRMLRGSLKNYLAAQTDSRLNPQRIGA